MDVIFVDVFCKKCCDQRLQKLTPLMKWEAEFIGMSHSSEFIYAQLLRGVWKKTTNGNENILQY